MMDLPKGYKLADDGVDHVLGYDCPYEFDFDMFCAFETANRGVVGGAKTVDDFTPEGLSDAAVMDSDGDYDGDSPSKKYP